VHWENDKQKARLNTLLLEMQGNDLIEFQAGAGLDDQLAFAFVNEGEHRQLYEAIDEDKRALYHRMAGQWLAHVAPAQGFHIREVMAWHFERGERPRRAASAYGDAARLAVASCQNRRALELYRKALTLYDAGEAASQCELYAELTDLLVAVGDIASAERAARELLYCSTLTEDHAQGGAAWLRFGRIAVVQGHYETAFKRLRKARSLFGGVEDISGVADCQEEIGHLHRVQGAFGSNKSALSCFVKSLGLRRQAADWNGVAGSLVQIGHIHLGQGQIKRAIDSYTEALEIRREQNDRFGIARVLNGLGAAHHEAGRTTEAAAAWSEGIEIASAAGDRQLTAMLQNNLAEARLLVEEVDAASDLLQSAHEAALEVGNRRLLAEVLRNQAEVSRVRGRFGTALQQVEQSLALGEEIQARRSVGMSLRTQGTVLAEMLRRGPTANTGGFPTEEAGDGAHGAFTRSIAYFEEMGDTLEQAQSMRAFGTFLLDRGETAKAKRIIARAETMMSPTDG
jgi:tetratricopeptide (TPR) repeat protein